MTKRHPPIEFVEIVQDVLRGSRFTLEDLLVSRKGRSREAHREVLALSVEVARRLHALGWNTQTIAAALQKHSSCISIWLARSTISDERKLLTEVANSGVDSMLSRGGRDVVFVRIAAPTWAALAKYRAPRERQDSLKELGWY